MSSYSLNLSLGRQFGNLSEDFCFSINLLFYRNLRMLREEISVNELTSFKIMWRGKKVHDHSSCFQNERLQAFLLKVVLVADTI